VFAVAAQLKKLKSFAFLKSFLREKELQLLVTVVTMLG
jgi:hypothetical protein